MGRYYTGDINGKFWFGVQSSNDAEFFGVHSEEVTIYHFITENLPKVLLNIEKCYKELGEYKDKLDTFFRENNGYTNKQLAEYLEINNDKLMTLLEWYARLLLGEEIEESLYKLGKCDFYAEL